MLLPQQSCSALLSPSRAACSRAGRVQRLCAGRPGSGRTQPSRRGSLRRCWRSAGLAPCRPALRRSLGCSVLGQALHDTRARQLRRARPLPWFPAQGFRPPVLACQATLWHQHCLSAAKPSPTTTRNLAAHIAAGSAAASPQAQGTAPAGLAEIWADQADDCCGLPQRARGKARAGCAAGRTVRAGERDVLRLPGFQAAQVHAAVEVTRAREALWSPLARGVRVLSRHRRLKVEGLGFRV